MSFSITPRPPRQYPNRIGHSISVKGDSSKKKGRPKFENWFAKIVSFDWDLSREELEGGEVDVSGSGDRSVTVVWFHEASDPLAVLAKASKDPEHIAIKEAFSNELHLLGSVSQLIPIESIKGK